MKKFMKLRDKDKNKHKDDRLSSGRKHHALSITALEQVHQAQLARAQQQQPQQQQQQQQQQGSTTPTTRIKHRASTNSLHTPTQSTFEINKSPLSVNFSETSSQNFDNLTGIESSHNDIINLKMLPSPKLFSNPTFNEGKSTLSASSSIHESMSVFPTTGNHFHQIENDFESEYLDYNQDSTFVNLTNNDSLNDITAGDSLLQTKQDAVQHDVEIENEIVTENLISNSVREEAENVVAAKSRRNSQISTFSTSTHISNIQETNKKLTQSLKHYPSTISLSSSCHPHNHARGNNIKHNPASLQSLVKSDWDDSTFKTAWVNRISENYDPRLYWIELKGSSLLVHKVSTDLQFAKSLIVDEEKYEDQSFVSISDKTMTSYLHNNNADKSTTDLSINTKADDSFDSISTPIPTPTKLTFSHLQNENSITSEDIQSITTENNKLGDVDESSILDEDFLHSSDETRKDDTAIEHTINFADLIQDYESSRNICKEIKDLNCRNIKESPQFGDSFLNTGKKVPFIIHELSYESPSCPHPKLVLDPSTLSILRGSLESLCHTIIFFPSDKTSDELIEILPLLSSLIDSFVYFQKYFDLFTNKNYLTMKKIRITDMEMKMLFSRLRRVIELSIVKFKGSLLDDEIFKLIKNLAKSLIGNCNDNLNVEELKCILNELDQVRLSLINLVSYQLDASKSNINSLLLLDINKSELISAKDFIMLPTDVLAHEIHSIDLTFMKNWPLRSDYSTILSRLETIGSSYNYWKFNPLQFVPAVNTHYLGRLLAYHIFEDPETSISPEKRSQILMKWIHLGIVLSDRGDMVSWLGIATVICSQPVLRLRETWSHIDLNYLQIIRKKWASVVFEVRKAEIFGTQYFDIKSKHNFNENEVTIAGNDIMETFETESGEQDIKVIVTNKIGERYSKKDAVPYYGELFTVNMDKIKDYARQYTGFETFDDIESDDYMKTNFVKEYISYMDSLKWNFNQWDVYYNNIVDGSGVKSQFSGNKNDEGIEEEKEDSKSSVLKILQTAIAFNSNNGPFPINHFMSMSVVVEPPHSSILANSNGSFRSPLFLGSYASILFPRLLSQYETYDHDELLGALGGTDLISEESSNKRLKKRNVYLKNIRDMFVNNSNGDEFKTVDNTLFFESLNAIPGTSDKKRNKLSSKLLFEDPLIPNSRHLSTVSTGSFNLDDYIDIYKSYLGELVEILGSESKINESELTRYFHEDGANNVSIVPSAATTDRLVDILVLSGSIFGMCLNEQDIKSYCAKNNIDEENLSFKLYDSSFSYTFFSTYRVFFTTKQLLEALRKRFDGAKSAALSIQEFVKRGRRAVIDDIFPKWDGKGLDDPEIWKTINWKLVLQIQLGVLEAVSVLVDKHFKHFIDDLETKHTLYTFLELLDCTMLNEWPKVLKFLKNSIQSDEYNVILDEYKLIQNNYRHVRNICIRKSYTPECEPAELSFSNELKSIPDENCLPTVDDINQIDQYVTQLNETIESSMKAIRYEDWLETFEVFQSLVNSSPLAMFNYNYQSSTTHYDLIKIGDIFQWLTTVKSGDKCDKDVYLLDKLPPTVRSIFKLYSRLQNIILAELVDVSLTLDERIGKMGAALRIIQICRLRMKNVKLSNHENNADIPSYIESIFVNTILLPQSRFFSFAWQSAVEVISDGKYDIKMFDQLDTILSLLNVPDGFEILENVSLSICPGWVAKRLLEVACFIPSMDINNTKLVNFEKSRCIHNCIMKIVELQKQTILSKISPYLSTFSFIFEYQGKIPSLKESYELSLKEKSENGLNTVSIFGKHIEDQIKLIKLEQSKRDLLLRQHGQTPMNSVNRSSMYSKDHINRDESSSIFTNTTSSFTDIKSLMDDTADNSIYDMSTLSTALDSSIADPNQSVQSIKSTKSSRTPTSVNSQPLSSNTKLTTASRSRGSSSKSSVMSHGSNKFKFPFFKSRPFSLNINTFNQPNVEKRSVKISELPDSNSMISKSKPYVSLHLKDATIFPTYRTPYSFTIDIGGQNHEHTFQVVNSDEVSEWFYKLTYCKKHWFFSKSVNKPTLKNASKMTFGVPLSFICKRDSSPVPIIIEKILTEIELRGLEEPGIYRKSASLTTIQQIKSEIDKTGDFNMENTLVFNIHNLTGCIKTYLRELPDPIIPDMFIDELSKVSEIAQSDARFELYKRVLSNMPILNQNLIERLSRHMKLIEEFKAHNRMTSYNLATIMGGSFVEGCKPDTMKKSFGMINFICEDWILHYDRVFQ